jgi:hypothetical protein
VLQLSSAIIKQPCIEVLLLVPGERERDREREKENVRGERREEKEKESQRKRGRRSEGGIGKRRGCLHYTAKVDSACNRTSALYYTAKLDARGGEGGRGGHALSIENVLHDHPESLLPFEDGLFGHHVWGDFALQTTGSEDRWGYRNGK